MEYSLSGRIRVASVAAWARFRVRTTGLLATSYALSGSFGFKLWVSRRGKEEVQVKLPLSATVLHIYGSCCSTLMGDVSPHAQCSSG